MKYIVKVEDRLFEVELNDLHTQPIVALVNGEAIEVWLESENGVKPYFALGQREDHNGKAQRTPKFATPPPSLQLGHHPSQDTQSILAPIPGIILSVAVQAGEEVSTGQELCVLEAMKMKNTIRAPRSGQIESVHVSTGQTVLHQDILMRYAG